MPKMILGFITGSNDMTHHTSFHLAKMGDTPKRLRSKDRPGEVVAGVIIIEQTKWAEVVGATMVVSENQVPIGFFDVIEDIACAALIEGYRFHERGGKLELLEEPDYEPRVNLGGPIC